MPDRYSYNLDALALHGAAPKQAVFTKLNPFVYRPTVTVMDAYEVNQNSPIPTQALLVAAKNHATNIRDKKVLFPVEGEERTYEGVDHWNIPKSRQLIELANAHGVGDVVTFFDDFLTAEFYRGALRPKKRVDDPTIPKTVAAMKLHVDLLVRAFKSTNDCDDNAPMIKPFDDRRHDSKLVECLCWAIVKACIFRAKSDEPLLTAYEPYKAKNSLGLDTFEKRFDAIATAMTRSKTICKHLFDAPYINVFVDDPLRSIRRVDANRDLNRQKADVMKKGKQLQQHLHTVTGVPAPTKKKSKGRKRSAGTAGLDMDGASSPVRTPPSAMADATRMTQSAPANGRVTRRMSKLAASGFHTPPASTTPVETPPTTRSYMDSSPPSSHTEIKDESSPLRPEQSQFMNNYNGVIPMGMYPNGFDQAVMQGIHFPQAVPRYAQPMGMNGMNYPLLNRSSYMGGSLLNFPSSIMGYRNGPMQPEEVSMSMAGPVSPSSSIIRMPQR